MKGIVLGGALLLAACIDETPTEFSDAVIECSFGEPSVLAVGEVVRESTGVARFCVESPDGGVYVLVPFVSRPRDVSAPLLVRVYGGGLAAAPTRLDAQVPPPRSAQVSSELEQLIGAHDDWHARFRAREAATLESLLSAPPLRGRVSPGPAAAIAPHAAARVPTPGDTFQLNVATACDKTDLRTARVAAVTRHAIVAYDPANPTSDPFTRSELLRFATEYDDLVHPIVSQSFGSSTDLDRNERVILFFTRAVNELVAPGGGTGLAIGFFYAGDIFPRTGIPGRTNPCPASNEAEVMFLAVPDPEGEIRVPVNRGTLAQVMPGTIAHELQHLVNASRRLHVTQATGFEETWLNEALSHAAEELMFYGVTGMRPGQNIDTTAIYAPGKGRTEAFNRYMYANLGRFDRFIQTPHESSPMGSDGHETRGAAWSYLRYALDRDPSDDGAVLRTLVNGPSAGLENLRAAFATDPLRLMEDWTVSVLADDWDPGVAALYQQPSWNLRELISALRVLDRRYPLRLLPLDAAQGFSVPLRSGSAAYATFAVRAGERAMVVVEAEGERGADLRTQLMRVR